MEKSLESSFTVPEYPETENRTPPHIDADAILNQHINAHGAIKKIKGTKEKHKPARTDTRNEPTPQNNNQMAEAIDRSSQEYNYLQTRITSPQVPYKQQSSFFGQLSPLEKLGLATLAVGGCGLAFYALVYCRGSGSVPKPKRPKSKNPNVEIEVTEEEEEEEEQEEEEEEYEQEQPQHGQRSKHKPKGSK